MGIKDLFDKGHSLKFVKNKTKQDLREDLESSKFVDEYVQKRNRLIPDVDFATASHGSFPTYGGFARLSVPLEVDWAGEP